ncbi:hypothetical protein Gorai_005667, partial [Gossypium raimondii]|nr:hypothetical protein [Gossypium raimondii]
KSRECSLSSPEETTSTVVGKEASDDLWKCDKKDLMHAVGSTFGGVIQSKIKCEFCRFRVNFDVQRPLRRGIDFCLIGCLGHWIKGNMVILSKDREKVKDDLPYSLALKAESSLLGRESLKLGFSTKKAMKQCYYTGEEVMSKDGGSSLEVTGLNHQKEKEASLEKTPVFLETKNMRKIFGDPRTNLSPQVTPIDLMDKISQNSCAEVVNLEEGDRLKGLDNLIGVQLSSYKKKQLVSIRKKIFDTSMTKMVMGKRKNIEELSEDTGLSLSFKDGVKRLKLVKGNSEVSTLSGSLSLILEHDSASLQTVSAAAKWQANRKQ